MSCISPPISYRMYIFSHYGNTVVIRLITNVVSGDVLVAPSTKIVNGSELVDVPERPGVSVCPNPSAKVGDAPRLTTVSNTKTPNNFFRLCIVFSVPSKS